MCRLLPTNFQNLKSRHSCRYSRGEQVRTEELRYITVYILYIEREQSYLIIIKGIRDSRNIGKHCFRMLPGFLRDLFFSTKYDVRCVVFCVLSNFLRFSKT